MSTQSLKIFEKVFIRKVFENVPYEALKNVQYFLLHQCREQLSTDFFSPSIFKTSPSPVSQPVQIFPTPASHFHPYVTPPQGGSDQTPPPMRSSTSVCQRHHQPPPASRVLKRLLLGVIKMSHFCTTKSLSREQFADAVSFSLLSEKRFFTHSL